MYIKKDIHCEIDTDLITIKKFDEEYNTVVINYLLYNRYLKLFKITKNEKLKKLLDIVQLCEINKKELQDIMSSILTKELTKNINNEILKNLIKFQKKMGNSKSLCYYIILLVMWI